MEPMQADQLIRAVNDLVTENFHVDEFLNEISKNSCIQINDQENLTASFVIGEKITKSSFSVWLCPNRRTLLTCINNILRCLESTNTSTVFLNLEQKAKVSGVIAAIHHSLEKEEALDDFRKAISMQSHIVFPLEFLFELHSSGLLPLREYLSRNLSRSSVITQFNLSVVQLCLESTEDQRNNEMTSDIIFFLVESAYAKNINSSDSIETGFQKICSVVLDSVIQRVVASAVHHNELGLNDRINPISVLIEKYQTKFSELTEFCKYMLNFLIKHDPSIKVFDIKKFVPVIQALAEQQNWQFKTTSPYFVNVIQKLLVVLEPQQVIHSLKIALENQEINWRILLVIVSTFTICHRQAPLLLEEFTESMLREGLGSCDQEHLLISLLLARQAATEGPPLCKTYAQWFQSSFGSPVSSLANTSKSFVILMRLLSKIVPHEPAIWLKVHLFNPPFVLPRVKQFYSDYCSLAKSRLQDLGEPIEETAIYSSVKSGTEQFFIQVGAFCLDHEGHTSNRPLKTYLSVKHKVELDVERAMELFELTGRIPSSVLEASLFRKQYFCGQFITTLLSPRIVPDVRDTKYKFIEALKKAGKISTHLYEEYYKKCKQETHELFAGIGSDDSVEIITEDPQEELDKVLEAFISERKIGGSSLCALVSQISSKILSILENVAPVKLILPNEMTLDGSGKSSMEIKRIIQCLCDLFMNCKQYDSNKQLEEDIEPSSRWDYLLVSMIHCHKVLHQQLLTRIKELMLLEEYDRSSLALLMFRVSQIFGPVVRNSPDNELSSISSAIFNRMPITIPSELDAFARLSSCYLQSASLNSRYENQDLPQEIPTILLKKFQFVAHCLYPTIRRGKTYALDDNNLQVYYDQKVQHWLSCCSVNFKEYVTFEGELIPDGINSEERLDRLRWWCFNHFQNEADTMISSLYSVLVSYKNLPSYFQLLTLLHELCHKSKHSSAIPWLQKEFQNQIGDNDFLENSSVMQSKLQRFFRVAYSLPSYLLFMGSTSGQPTSQSLQSINNIIENYLKPHMCEDGFLPRALTQYFLDGFRSANIAISASTLPTILATAVVVHWHEMKIYFGQDNRQDTFLWETAKLVKWCQDLSKNNSEPRPSGLPTWLQGLAICFHAEEHLWGKTGIFQSLTPEICQYTIQFWLTRKGVQLLLSVEILWEDLSVRTVPCLPLPCYQHCFQPAMYQKSILTNIFPENIWTLYPAACLSFLLKALECDNWREYFTDKMCSTLLSLLLDNLSECQRESKTLKPSLAFLMNVSERILTCLKRLPQAIIRIISNDSKYSSDEYIQMIINQRVK